MVGSARAAGVPRPGADQAAILAAVVVGIPVARARHRRGRRGRRARGGRLGGRAPGRGHRRRRGRGGARGGGANGGGRPRLGQVADAAGRAARVLAGNGNGDKVFVQQGAVDIKAIVDLRNGAAGAGDDRIDAKRGRDGANDGARRVRLGVGWDDAGVVENLCTLSHLGQWS